MRRMVSPEMSREQHIECGGTKKRVGAAALSHRNSGALGNQRFRLVHDRERSAELDFTGRELLEERAPVFMTAAGMPSVHAAAIVEIERTRLPEAVLAGLTVDGLDGQAERSDRRDVLRFHFDRTVQGPDAAQPAREAQRRRMLGHYARAATPSIRLSGHRVGMMRVSLSLARLNSAANSSFVRSFPGTTTII